MRARALILSLIFCGCSDPSSVPFEVTVVDSVDQCTEEQPLGTLSSQGVKVSLLRLTVTRTTEAGERELVCNDSVRTSPGSPGSFTFSLETYGPERLDLQVDAFDADLPPRLIASGSLYGINANTRSTPLQVILSPASGFGCTAAPMARGRAFHSATALPNGDVLLVGGVTTPAAAQEGDGLRLNDTLEVYRPQTGTFLPVQGALPAARAFHSAFLLSGPPQGPYDILLVGGVSAAAFASEDGAVVRVGTGTDPLPLMPMDTAVPATSVVIRYTPWGEAPHVQVKSSSPVLDGRMFHAAALGLDDDALVAGGIASDALDPVVNVELLYRGATTEHRGPYPLAVGRMGGMAAPLAEDRMLVFGGNLFSHPVNLTREAAEIVHLGEEVSVVLADYDGRSEEDVVPTAHGSLDRVGRPNTAHLIMVGGLQIGVGAAQQVGTTPVALSMTLVNDKLRVIPVEPGPLVPTAYHGTAVLRGGDLLITGGLPSQCEAGALCATDAVIRYKGSEARPSFVDEERTLRVPRMGHAVTRLPDDTLLVSGGLTYDAEREQLSALPSAETYAPYAGQASTDPFRRGPGELTGERCK